MVFWNQQILSPFWKSCCSSQSACEQHDGGGIEIGFGAGGECLEVLGEVTISAESSEYAFDYPSARQDLEAFCIGGTFDDFDDAVAKGGDSRGQLFAMVC